MPLAQSLTTSSRQLLLQVELTVLEVVLVRSCRQHCGLASLKGALSKLMITAAVLLLQQQLQQQLLLQSLLQLLLLHQNLLLWQQQHPSSSSSSSRSRSLWGRSLTCQLAGMLLLIPHTAVCTITTQALASAPGSGLQQHCRLAGWRQ
jgi:hypothetical protein